MQINDLEIFNEMPFLFWVKDKSGKHLFGNKVICNLAGEDVAGKTDHELVWAKDADALQEHDRQVLETGEPSFIHEHVQQSSQGDATLNVCKWVGELEGERCCFGISFIIGS
jgi:PAS domain-containing protein